MISQQLGDLGTHPRLKGFDAFYEGEIAPSLKGFEDARQKAMGKAPWAILPLALGALGLVLKIDMLAIGGFAIGVIILLLVWSEASKAKKHHGTFIAGKVCTYFGLDYSPTAKTNLIPWFQDLKLLPRYDRKSSEDFISGAIGDTDIWLVETELEERRTRRDSKGRRQTYYVTVFSGLLAVVTFPKRFSSTTLISSDAGIFGFLGGLGKSGERAKLEDPAFEKRFDVYTDDQVECRYLLTPTFMERLVKVDDSFGGGLEAAFSAENFLMAIRSNHNWFEAVGQSADLRDPSAIVSMVKDVTMLFDLVDDLNLNAKTKA